MGLVWVRFGLYCIQFNSIEMSMNEHLVRQVNDIGSMQNDISQCIPTNSLRFE